MGATMASTNTLFLFIAEKHFRNFKFCFYEKISFTTIYT